MVRSSSTSGSFLICRSDSRLCALPLQHVVETMRALPLESFPDMPPFLLGVSIIRGAAVPVVNVARLLNAAADSRPGRYISFKLANRQLAFAVESVVGIRELAAESLADIPPLLREADAAVVARMAALDTELISVLQGAHLIPEPVWDALDARCGQR
jgi:purine-binding chemotaxis protein CheW